MPLTEMHDSYYPCNLRKGHPFSASRSPKVGSAKAAARYLFMSGRFACFTSKQQNKLGPVSA
jgi:hypothetical protein